MYGALDIAVSGMVAQRQRLETATANIAIAGSPVDRSNPEGFRRKIALLAPGATDAPGRGRGQRPLGVRVAEIVSDQAPFRKVHDPGHPYAAKETDPERGLVEGYYDVPNIDPVIEEVNALEASRAYEANVMAAEAVKTMLGQALRLIA
jgi:flagellar basal-body rod protein FlgC